MKSGQGRKKVPKELVVSASPHIKSGVTTEKLMWSVVIALLPAFLGSIYFFGLKSLLLVGLSIASALLSEAFAQKIFGRKITITDGSAVITGILLAFNLPPGVPLWMPIIGSAFAIIIAKQFFGGLGYNFVNPALAGRAFLMISWPYFMTAKWLAPNNGYLAGFDAVTQATPLTLLKNTLVSMKDSTITPEQLALAKNTLTQLNSLPVIKNLFFGNVGGCLGETSALLLLVGAIFLLATKVIDYRIPVSYLGTVTILSLIIPTQTNVLFQLFSGGLFLGAFFMATDYVTSPVTKLGRWLFGIGCGLLTVIIRTWGGYPEGVSYSILFMNLLTPLIDRYTKPRVFGVVKK
uniref:Ion-translocating oxidoreductase complex subunit D n=1 Tax=candidate division WOR-3 bacterium TaxID=2052148 RepID=A0A7C6A912_UNCW3